MSKHTPSTRLLACLSLVLIVAAACYPPAGPVSPATPAVDPDIYSQVPDTTVYNPGECSARLDAAALAYISNTLGGQPSGEIAAGAYDVGMAADYGSSLWFMLSGVEGPNWIASASVWSLEGLCAATQ